MTQMETSSPVKRDSIAQRETLRSIDAIMDFTLTQEPHTVRHAMRVNIACKQHLQITQAKTLEQHKMKLMVLVSIVQMAFTVDLELPSMSKIHAQLEHMVAVQE